VAEQLGYARRASGLVRGLGLFDTFGVGFTNQGLVAGIGVVTTLGLGVFLGGNIIVAAVISVLLAAVGFTLVWGTLGGAMPRSGGPYIYNTRVLHPLVGIAQSFGDALIWLWWIGTLAPYAVDPGLVMLCQFMGWGGAAAWLQHDYALFLAASLINLIGFLHVVFGLKVFALAQRFYMAVIVAGSLALSVVFTTTSHFDFVRHWNEFAQQHQSLDYQQYLARVDAAVRAAGGAGGVPATWNWPDTLGVMLAMSWLFAYSYSIAFVGGEVRRPERTMLWAHLLAIVMPFALFIWVAWALYHSVGFEFLSAASWHDQSGGGADTIAGYALPWAPSVYGLAAVITHNRFAMALIAIAFVACNIWWVALSYLAFPRTLFAWGMDRMGPRWFAQISPRYASPVKNHVLCFALGELLIFVYAFLYSDKMQNITLTGLEITSVFAITAVAALVFPYSRRARAVWAASPYAGWRFLGLPVVVWGAFVNLVYLGILLYALIAMKASSAFQWFTFGMFVFAWVLGIGWYYFWRARNRAAGIDARATYDQLPPE